MKKIYFNINKNCNSRCKFCAADLESFGENKDIILLEDIKKIKNSLDIVENDTVILNGGEPTLNPDLISIINCFSIEGINTTLFTNGRRLRNIDFTKSIVDAGINKITIPIYGYDNNTHDSITRAKGSFEDLKQALKHLNDFKNVYSFLLEIKILICKDNYDYLDKIVNFLLSEYNIDLLMVSGLIPSKDAKINDQVLKKEESKYSINLLLSEYFKEKNKPQIVLDGIPLCHLNEKNKMLFILQRSFNKIKINNNIEKSYYIDCQDKYKIEEAKDINQWDTIICPKLSCKYNSICRLNTLLNHKEFLSEWIEEQ